MKRFMSYVGLATMAGMLVLTGCKKGKKTTPKKVTQKTKTPTARKAPAAAGNWTMKAYEVVRVALAADNLADAQKGAKALAEKAKGKAAFSKIGEAAKKLAGAKDIANARLAFGNLSKNLIAYISANPKHSKGVTAYECPMAKGYKKWLQADAKMANPYMGKKMLTCGGKTKLSL